MDRLIIENVRCFRGRHEVPLAPLTILVGENSTGKSTVLAMARLAWDMASGQQILDFNEEPFLLGSYDQIESTLRIADNSIPRFSLGALWNGKTDREYALFSGDFFSYRGQPGLASWRKMGANYQVIVKYKLNGDISSLEVRLPSGDASFDGEDLPTAPRGVTSQWVASILSWLLAKDDFPNLPASIANMNVVADLSFSAADLESRPYAFSPMRTRPRKTYDPVQETADSEGSHVPMVLANASFAGGVAWDALKRSLDGFGAESGLYESIAVRHLGPSASDPFQIQLSIGGSVVNLIDVGYGVSQALPIVVDCLRAGRGRTLLLQQPEVHLHPKAQAELGSFLTGLSRQEEKRFLIETHSDYLVDRIRMDIREKKHGLGPEDVAFLYFEREAGEVRIHHLELDEQGDIVNAPPGYRKFILQEERRFLGI